MEKRPKFSRESGRTNSLNEFIIKSVRISVPCGVFRLLYENSYFVFHFCVVTENSQMCYFVVFLQCVLCCLTFCVDDEIVKSLTIFVKKVSNVEFCLVQ